MLNSFKSWRQIGIREDQPEQEFNNKLQALQSNHFLNKKLCLLTTPKIKKYIYISYLAISKCVSNSNEAILQAFKFAVVQKLCHDYISKLLYCTGVFDFLFKK